MKLIIIPCYLFVFLCCFSLTTEAKKNKKLQRIILASLISKSLKGHLGGGGGIVPIMLPQHLNNFKTYVFINH